MKLTNQDIWRLTRMPDVCMTDIIKSKEYISPDYAARKWSVIRDHSDFSLVCDTANELYCLMTELEHFCPEVHRFNIHGLQMEWSSDDRIVTIRLEPGLPISYSWGLRNANLRVIQLTRPLSDMVKCFNRFLKYETEEEICINERRGTKS